MKTISKAEALELMEQASRQPMFNCYVPAAERGEHRYKIRGTNFLLLRMSRQYTNSWVKWVTKIEHINGLCFPSGKFQADLRQARKLLA
jgi:hypothetical protein